MGLLQPHCGELESHILCSTCYMVIACICGVGCQIQDMYTVCEDQHYFYLLILDVWDFQSVLPYFTEGTV